MPYPFLQPAFFHALEQSDSTGTQAGWQPQHIAIKESGQTIFMPCYLKSHSWGEYVFDWAWAEAYQRNGLAYYPKLVTAIPFSPVTGPRIRHQQEHSLSDHHYQQLAEQAIEQTREQQASGWHILFTDSDTTPALAATQSQTELLHRTGIQYHWFNRDYRCFDDFLAQLKSRKRKMIRRERASSLATGLRIEMLSGDQISRELWSFFYRMYVNTYLKRSGSRGYLQPGFFSLLGELLPDQLAMAVAYREQQPVAAALYLFDEQRLYGRYWGCSEENEHLHFELCYYQGIELAIQRGLECFDAGAQGEHKILRGFEPVTTHSFHWIAEPTFREPIADFLRRETQHNQLHRQQAEALLPYRTNCN